MTVLDHTGVLDGHHARERAPCEHEATRVLGEMAWKAHYLRNQPHQLLDRQVVDGKAGFSQPVGTDLPTVPPHVAARDAVEGLQVKAQGLANIPDRTARTVADDCRSQRSAVASVAPVQVLDDLFAPLVLEVDVNVRRLVALFRDETLEQHRSSRRVDLGDADAVTDHAVGSRPTALTQDVL